MRRLGVNFAYVSDGGNTFGVSLLKNLTSVGSTADWSWNPIGATNNINGILPFPWRRGHMDHLHRRLQGRRLDKGPGGADAHHHERQDGEFPGGRRVPHSRSPVGYGAGTTITIEYKTFGVGLNFTPTVLNNNKISMEVKPEVSELDFTNAVHIGYIVPSLTTRRVATTIELADGQSFAIAGLLKEDLREVVSKFPVLGEIPILGVLFRSTSYQKNETELVIIVTPHLVKPVDMAKQTLPTDAFVEPNEFEFYLLGSLEGRGEPAKSKGAAAPPRSDKGGLEGDFGHIAPK